MFLILYFKWFPAFTDQINQQQTPNIKPPGAQTAKSVFALSPVGSFFDAPRNILDIQIDWHDYKLIGEEKRRTGIGEQGVKAELGVREKVLERKISGENGFNGLLSDKISVNRSIPDIRHPE
jgi:hypothetical protein